MKDSHKASLLDSGSTSGGHLTSDTTSQLQEEVRHLHFLLKHKDQIIDSLKSIIKQQDSSQGSGPQEESKAMAALQQVMDKETRVDAQSKEYEKTIMNLLAS